jgi:hypothetical protein
MMCLPVPQHSSQISFVRFATGSCTDSCDTRPGLASSPLRFRPAGGKALANFDQLPTRGPLGAGKCLLAGELVETPPVSGPKFRSAGRRPFQNFRNFGPPALKFRPVDELASPARDFPVKRHRWLLKLPQRLVCSQPAEPLSTVLMYILYIRLDRNPFYCMYATG